MTSTNGVNTTYASILGCNIMQLQCVLDEVKIKNHTRVTTSLFGLKNLKNKKDVWK